jgi:membrane fusion protein (multidrug efflux system)
MKKFLMICMMFSMAACSGNKEENKDLATKKAELDNLTKERDAIVAKIATLETEIQKMSGATVEEKTKLVEVTELITQDFAHYIDLQGKITTENLYYVTPRGMGGQVKAIFVKQGDNVKAGQLLMKLEDGIIQQNIKQVESQLEFAKNIFTRQENLWKEGIGTEVQFLSAKNNVEGLEKQLSLVKEQLGTTSVIAQVSGVVETVSIRVGETFVGSPMAGITIVNPSAMKAVVEVPENYVVKVRKGMPVVISVPDLNETFNSTISLVSETINTISRSFIAESKMPSKSTIKPNQVAVVKILDHAAKNAIVVPVETVQTDEKGKYVYILSLENGKNLARKKMVTIGEFYDELIEVNTGLTKGDKLITKGFQGLYDGQLISTATN